MIDIGDVLALQTANSPPLYLHCVADDRDLGRIYAVLRERPARGRADAAAMIPGRVWFLAATSAEVAVAKGYAAIVGRAAPDPVEYRVRDRDGRWLVRQSGREVAVHRKLSAAVREVQQVAIITPLGLLDVTADPAYDLEQDLASARARAAGGPSLLKSLFSRRPPGPASRLEQRLQFVLRPEAVGKAQEVAARLGWQFAVDSDAGPLVQVTLSRIHAGNLLIADLRHQIEQALDDCDGELVAAETITLRD